MTTIGDRPPEAETCGQCECELEDGFRYCLVCGSPARVTQPTDAQTTSVFAPGAELPATSVFAPGAEAPVTSAFAPGAAGSVATTQVIPAARTGLEALLAGPTQQTAILDRPATPGPASAPGPGADIGPVAASEGAGRVRPPRPNRRSRGWLVLLLILALVATAFGGWYYLQESRRSDQVQAVLSQDRQVLDGVLAKLASAPNTAAIRTAAKSAVDQAQQHAGAVPLAADTGNSENLRLLGRALDALAGLRNLTADSLDSWSAQQPKIASALRAAPALATESKAVDAALANVAAVVRRGQTALASWEQATADAEQSATESVSALDEYATAVRNEIDSIRHAQQNGGAALRDSDFGPNRGYEAARAAAAATAADLESVVGNLQAQTNVPALSWQHDEIIHAVSTMAGASTSLASAFSDASQCRTAAQSVPNSVASSSPAASAPTASASPAVSAGVPVTTVADTSRCDQLARDAWDTYTSATSENGPALDSAISGWESRLATQRSELAAVSGPPKPEV